MDSHANFAYGTVLTAPSPATTDTTLVLNSGQGALFPTPPFNVTIWPAGVIPQSTNAEIARCTALSTDTMTLVRHQEGTSARAIVVGDQVALTVTSKVLTDIEAADALAAKKAFVLGIGGVISPTMTDAADFYFVAPWDCTLLRMKATVKAAVNTAMTVQLRSAAGPITTPPAFSNVSGFVCTFSSGNVIAVVDPADVNLSEGDMLGLSVATGSGVNLQVEVVAVAR